MIYENSEVIHSPCALKLSDFFDIISNSSLKYGFQYSKIKSWRPIWLMKLVRFSIELVLKMRYTTLGFVDHTTLRIFALIDTFASVYGGLILPLYTDAFHSCTVLITVQLSYPPRHPKCCFSQNMLLLKHKDTPHQHYNAQPHHPGISVLQARHILEVHPEPSRDEG